MKFAVWIWMCLSGLLAAGELKPDIEFARRDGVALTLDAFVPDGPGPAPAAIWVHGGGFVAGDKKPHPKALLGPLEQKGWAWFSVNYRLAPKYVFPAQTDDVESAVAYIKSHAREFKIDANRLVLIGASAGGHLVSFVGAHHAKANGVAAVVPFFGEHDLVDRVHPKGPCMVDGHVVENPGLMCLSPGLSKFLGVTAESPNAEEVVRKASPATYVKKNMPAYLLIHGTKDYNVPFEQSERMLEQMKKAGARCELIRVEGGGHGFGAWDKDPSMSGYRERMLEWLDKTVRSSVASAQDLAMRTLSGRPDMVTGGSALVEIGGPGLDSVRVVLDGRDVTTAFRAGRTPGALLGRVEGLKPGKNILEARANGKRARLELINSSISGPVFSGRRQAPFACKTEEAGLGTPLDPDCSAKTKIEYFYKGSAPTFKELDPSAPRPADLAKTTTSEGKPVNYIVRRERGTINRAIYSIAFLHEPGEPLPDPWTRASGWNGRLVYSFGGGCRAGYRQALPLGGMDDALLSKGYAQATSSLNVFGNNCDDVISAETLMMVKEYFVKNFGVPVHTIGSGGSGGSMQQHLIAQNYPGLLDGITPAASYPDITTLVAPVADCTLLSRFFESASQPWTEEQMTAVSGFATWRTCRSWISSHFSPGWIEPGYCEASVPKALIYDPARNPRGVRCTLQDNQVNVYGRDEGTGFAPPFVDSEGVQYGLAAFNAGKISAEQFVELNERIGGFDRDGNVIAKRTAADTRALRIAYRTGRVNSGSGGLGSIPIIDVRPYLDTKGDIHDRVRSFEARARLVRANGQAGNHVILINPRNVQVVPEMDRWLDRIGQDKSTASAARVANAKPADLVDACWTPEGDKIAEPANYDGHGRCNQLYPPFADPRLVAGAPLANDVLKCALKPVNAEDYKLPLSERQLQRLKAVFPRGVCDYSRPGEEQAGAPEPWLRY